ncbi:MAG: hypothetical protein ACRDT0_16815 [Pseudonocardiaceae bacterium]
MTEPSPIEVHVRRHEDKTLVEIQEWGLVADQPQDAMVEQTAQQLLMDHFGLAPHIAQQVRLRVTVEPSSSDPL